MKKTRAKPKANETNVVNLEEVINIVGLSPKEEGLPKKMEELSEKKFEIAEIKKELVEIKTTLAQLQNSIDKNLKGLIEIQQRLIHTQLGAPIPPPPKENEEESAPKAKLTIIKTNDLIRVTGNTFDFRSTIKESGFNKWEQSTKSWSGINSDENLEKLVKGLESLNLVKGTDFIINDNSTNNTKPTREEDKDEDEDKMENNDNGSDGGFGSGYQ